METLLAVLMLAGFALIAGAFLLFRRGDRKKALLMLIAGLVMFANVAVLIAPTPNDLPPVTEGRANAPVE